MEVVNVRSIASFEDSSAGLDELKPVLMKNIKHYCETSDSYMKFIF